MAIGATVWARKTIESEIFYYKPAMWFKIWFYLVSRVNWEDGKLFKKGEALITYKEIMAATRASKAQVEKCMKYLKKEDMVDSRRTTRGEVRFILKYAQYQDWSYYKEELKKTKEKTYGRLEEGTDSRNKNTRKNKKLYKKDLSISLVDENTKQKRKSSAKKKKDYESLGEFKNIKLTKEEQVKLRQKHGVQETENAIVEMSLWLKQNNNTYKDYYAALLNWIRRHKEKTNQAVSKPNTPMYDDYDA